MSNKRISSKSLSVVLSINTVTSESKSVFSESQTEPVSSLKQGFVSQSELKELKFKKLDSIVSNKKIVG